MGLELDAPNLGDKEKQSIITCIESGFVSTVGPFVPEFERLFASYVGSKRAVSTQSGTAAIHLALHELGIGQGDEVIAPVTTFVATVNPVLYVRAVPVFVDVDEHTWNIDPVNLRRAITKKTRAIVPVHLFGNPCNMDEIMSVSREYGIPVVEDATESLGASYNGRHTGSFGMFGCFSFNGNKVITTGGGGMIVTDVDKAADHIRFLANQAKDEKDGPYHPEVGFNYRMTNLEASLGIAQFSRLQELLEKKTIFRSIYERVFGRRQEIYLQEPYAGSASSWWLNAALFDLDNFRPEQFKKKLYSIGIPSRRMFRPIADFPPFKKYANADYPVSRKLFERVLCLPSSTLNDPDEVEKSARVILELLDT